MPPPAHTKPENVLKVRILSISGWQRKENGRSLVAVEKDDGME